MFLLINYQKNFFNMLPYLFSYRLFSHLFMQQKFYIFHKKNRKIIQSFSSNDYSIFNTYS